nr:thermonuclease family protein [Rhizobium cremeum]
MGRNVKRSWSILRDFVVGFCILLLGLLVAAKLERQQEAEFSGHFVVIDGDTLALGPERLRLEGIDAPETGQTCGADDAPWDCGSAARRRLTQLAGAREFICHGGQPDRYRRKLVRCQMPEGDPAAVLVQEGLAVSYGDYRVEEGVARRERRGLWAGPFDVPQEWRRIHKTGEVEPAGDFFAFFLQWLGIN